MLMWVYQSISWEFNKKNPSCIDFLSVIQCFVFVFFQSRERKEEERGTVSVEFISGYVPFFPQNSLSAVILEQTDN